MALEPEEEGIEEGECRRYAPRPMNFNPRTDEAPKVDAFFPIMLPDEWCGEWEEKR